MGVLYGYRTVQPGLVKFDKGWGVGGFWGGFCGVCVFFWFLCWFFSLERCLPTKTKRDGVLWAPPGTPSSCLWGGVAGDWSNSTRGTPTSNCAVDVVIIAVHFQRNAQNPGGREGAGESRSLEFNEGGEAARKKRGLGWPCREAKRRGGA